MNNLNSLGVGFAITGALVIFFLPALPFTILGLLLGVVGIGLMYGKRGDES